MGQRSDRGKTWLYPLQWNIKHPPYKRKLPKTKNCSKTSNILIFDPEKGYCTGILIKASVLSNLECAIIIPQVPNYPTDVLEVVASVCLRERLKIVDGNEVTVTVDV